jgi:hypothetical protein
MVRHRWLVWLVAACGLATGAQARAHFVFIRIGPMAEAGRSAEVYFSEQAEAGDPRFIDKVAQTKLWAQTTPGRFEPLDVHKGADRLRAALPTSGSVSVVGICEYGIRTRPDERPFLLRYYPKAIAGDPDELRRMSPKKEIPLEIVATVEGDHLDLVALDQGRPLPEAVFHTVDADLTSTEIKAGADGRARWSPPAPGRYSVYVRHSSKTAGEQDGQHYDEIRAFATLAFEWPLGRKGADPEAVAMFEEALATRAEWVDFPGFRASIEGETNGRPFAGELTVSDIGEVVIKTDDPAARDWLDDQLGSLVMHRLPGDSSRPKPIVRFGDDRDDHPLGRLLIFEGGRFASSYRVKDRQITVVNRHVGQRNMTITVLDNERTAEGRFLPRSYLVHYWDARTGALDRVETFQNRWRRLGAWDLPIELTVTIASDAGLAVRSVRISGHALIEKKAK